MRHSRQRTVSTAILFGGLALLAIGVVSAVIRHNRSIDEKNEKRAELHAKYTKALEVADRTPHFEVSFVKFRLSELGALTTGGADRPRYEIVRTEVADRIRAGIQHSDPSFASLPTDFDFAATFARAYRENRVEPLDIFVAALLVTQTSPPVVSEFRLDVDRVAVTKVEDIYDLTDVTAAGKDRSRPHRPEVVRWKPSATGAGALVPLCVLHSFRIPDIPANREILQTGVWDHWQLASVAMLVPRRLFVVLPKKGTLEVDIGRALMSPLDLAVGR